MSEFTVAVLIARLTEEASRSSLGLETPVYVFHETLVGPAPTAFDVDAVKFDDESELAGIYIEAGDEVEV